MKWRDFIAESIRQSCLWEARAPKPGNVHPQASFADLTFDDFVLSADAAAPELAQAEEIGVGAAVERAIRATRDVCPHNTNLGIALAIAPLAAVPEGFSLSDGIERVLARLTREDAEHVYAAIRLAQPGGMGRVEREDVSQTPQVTLREAMCLAASRDAIAAQYAGRFELVLDFGVPQLVEWRKRYPLETAIVGLHLSLMARQPDTLIARKCGAETANESAHRAAAVLDLGWPETPASLAALTDFDRWLRSDGNRLNPGTTADLVAATLFAALRERVLSHG